MAEFIPFDPSIPHQRLEVSILNTPIIIDARWNPRDEAFYLDLFDVDETPIIRSIKVVLGVDFFHRSSYPLFVGRSLFAIDTSGTGVECGIDDLGGRIQIAFFNERDVLLATTPSLPINNPPG